MRSSAVALACVLGLAGLAQPARADLVAQFQDGAPKDRFTFTNTGACEIAGLSLTLDLGTAPAGLIFDTEPTGAGVEVFQPLEVVRGAGALARIPQIADGASVLALEIDRLPPGGEIALTVDVDDTTSTRQITVSGSEMAGASLRSQEALARFDAQGAARLALATQACVGS